MTNETWERACRAAGIRPKAEITSGPDGLYPTGNYLYPPLGDPATVYEIQERLKIYTRWIHWMIPPQWKADFMHLNEIYIARTGESVADAIIECAAAMEGK